jgi:excisionase family DNA binding protein
MKRAFNRKTKGESKPAPEAGVDRLTYTVEELCEAIGRNRVGVYADLAAGRIPSRRLGNRYIISRAAIQRWLEQPDSQNAA